MRTFDGGATRDDDTNKPDYEGYLSPLVIRRYGEYMLKHQRQSDGTMRSSDNWQYGIPRDAYMKSLWRHFFDVWSLHRGYNVWNLPRGYTARECIEEALCALIFNAMGYLHEHLKESGDRRLVDIDASYETYCAAYNDYLDEHLTEGGDR